MMILKKLLLLTSILIVAGCLAPRPANHPQINLDGNPSTYTGQPPADVPATRQKTTTSISDDTPDITKTEVIEPEVSEPVVSESMGAELVVSQMMVNSDLTGVCPASHFQNVQPHAGNTAYPAPQVNVTCGPDTFTVQANGIPNFEFVQTTPNDLQAQNYSWEIPLRPQPAPTPSPIPLLGPVAVAVNGIPIYGPNEAPQDNLGDPYLDQMLDYCGGHTAQRGDYHFHVRPDCLFTNLEGQVGVVIAYAFDGYPILAPYICQDTACSSVKKVQSSWQRTQEVRPAWEAHEYIAGSGDLDQCNGLEFSDGSYAYFATDTFPYFLGCYHGVTNGANTAPDLPPGNGPVGNGPVGNGPVGNGQGDGPTNRGPNGRPNLADVAAQLGVSEQALQEALGPPPPNLAVAARQLGVSEQTLREALGPPPGRGNGRP